MSDPLHMSLDDIIKQKKTKKTQVVGAKGKKATLPGRKTNKASISFTASGRVFRNFRGKLPNSPRQKNGFSPSRRGRGGGRYFNLSPRKGSYKWEHVAGNNRRPIRQRRPRNQNAMPLEGYQYWRGPLLNRTATRAISKQSNPAFKPARRFNWQGKRTFAQKSVNRARQRLIRQRILQNNRTRGQYTPTGRILVGQYGLVTTQPENVRERQNMMQRKIQRARQIREQQTHNVISESIVFSRRGRGRIQQQGQIRNRSMSRMWSSPVTYDDVHSSTPSPRFRFAAKNTDDEWIPPLMTVRNSEQQQRSASTPVRPGLDPNIQRKIKYIQQQGRKNRGMEGTRQGPVATNTNRYLEEDDDASNFLPTIITSRMSLSDRFRSFMGS